MISVNGYRWMDGWMDGHIRAEIKGKDLLVTCTAHSFAARALFLSANQIRSPNLYFLQLLHCPFLSNINLLPSFLTFMK